MCPHDNAGSGKFCPDCGHPVNTVMREPGEVTAMLARLPEILQLKTTQEPLVALFKHALISGTLQWVQGKIPTEKLVDLLRDPPSRD